MVMVYTYKQKIWNDIKGNLNMQWVLEVLIDLPAYMVIVLPAYGYKQDFSLCTPQTLELEPVKRKLDDTWHRFFIWYREFRFFGSLEISLRFRCDVVTIFTVICLIINNLSYVSVFGYFIVSCLWKWKWK